MAFFKNGFMDALNSTSVALGSAAMYTGIARDVSGFPSVTISAFADADGTMFVEFSPDTLNWDSSNAFAVFANIREVHSFRVSSRYFRLRYVNGSVAQTAFRAQSIVGMQTQITSALNSIVQADADAIVVRPMDFNLMVAESLYANRNNTVKDGENFDIDTGSVPEDITNEGGLYAGFPTGAVEAGEIVVAGADTGTVYYSYLESPTSTDYIISSIAIAGSGTYALGHNIWRCNFAYFISNSPATTNIGDITVRNTPTTGNVFCIIPATYGQSKCSAYTVPYGSSIFIDRISGELIGSTSGTMKGEFFYREYGGGGYRYRFSFQLQFGSLYFDDVDYLIRIPERVDFIPRIISCSANNLGARISYRFIKTKS